MSEATGPVEPTAKQRLQATRQALMHELVPSTRSETARRLAAQDALSSDSPELASLREREAAFGQGQEPQVPMGSGWFSVARHSLRAWWEFHPVRVAGVIAEPVLAEYARQRPLKLVGIAAGLGAVVVVTRPWRLVSLGGLAVAALKSSQVSNLALTFLSSRKKH